MFIVAEGVEGAGKSTQVKILTDTLQAMGYDVVRTREPGGTPLAEQIRNLVVQGDPGSMDAQTETLLFVAARRHHVETVIKPALARGCIVVCDRFLDSTHALQGAAGVPAVVIDDLHDTFIGLSPDFVLFFDMDPQSALDRANERIGSTSVLEDRMEKKGIGFHQKVSDILRDRLALPNRLRIDAVGTIDEVAHRVQDVVIPRLPSLSI